MTQMLEKAKKMKIKMMLVLIINWLVLKMLIYTFTKSIKIMEYLMLQCRSLPYVRYLLIFSIFLQLFEYNLISFTDVHWYLIN